VAVAPVGLAERPPGLIESIGVVFDGSPESLAALDLAARLAGERRAVLRRRHRTSSTRSSAD
jgi:hypothetical protein